MLTGTAAAAASAAEAATPATTLALAAAVFTVAAVTAASKEVVLTTYSRGGKGMEQCQAKPSNKNNYVVFIIQVHSFALICATSFAPEKIRFHKLTGKVVIAPEATWDA